MIKRRTVANEACDAGRVLVNGKAARASYEVKPQDVLQLEFGGRTLKLRVLEVKEAVRKEEVGTLYTLID